MDDELTDSLATQPQPFPSFFAHLQAFLSVLFGPHFHCRPFRLLIARRCLALALIAFASVSFSQTASTPATDPHAIPIMDGGIGPCSADFTITDSAGAPVYAAKVKVHIAYGFLNVHKLDLEQGTNIDGKARFVGLPVRIKHGLHFHASEGDRSGEAFDDPANTCKVQFTITLQKKTR